MWGLVYIIQDCRVPLLVRRANNYYHFISTWFILGIMDGETAQMVKSGEIVRQKFEIRGFSLPK